MKVDISDLVTVQHYAKKQDVTTAYIYKLIKANVIPAVQIDGVYFINYVIVPEIPKKK